LKLIDKERNLIAMVFGIDTETTFGKALVYVGGAVAAGSVVTFGVAVYHKKRVREAAKRAKVRAKAQRKRDKVSKAANVVVDKAKLMVVLKEVLVAMKSGIARVAEQEQSIRERNPRATDETLMEFCREQFMRTMAQSERNIYGRHGVTEASLKAVADKQAEDADLKAVVASMQQIVDVFSPPKDVEVPESFTKEKLIEFMVGMMGKMAEHVEKLSADLKATPSGAALNEQQFASMLATRFRANAEAVTNNLLKEYGIQQPVLQKALRLHQADPDFQQATSRAQIDQQKRFQAAGMMF
jgi:hypothetical protein